MDNMEFRREFLKEMRLKQLNSLKSDNSKYLIIFNKELVFNEFVQVYTRDCLKRTIVKTKLDFEIDNKGLKVFNSNCTLKFKVDKESFKMINGKIYRFIDEIECVYID